MGRSGVANLGSIGRDCIARQSRSPTDLADASLAAQSAGRCFPMWITRLLRRKPLGKGPHGSNPLEIMGRATRLLGSTNGGERSEVNKLAGPRRPLGFPLNYSASLHLQISKLIANRAYSGIDGSVPSGSIPINCMRLRRVDIQPAIPAAGPTIGDETFASARAKLQARGLVMS